MIHHRRVTGYDHIMIYLHLPLCRRQCLLLDQLPAGPCRALDVYRWDSRAVCIAAPHGWSLLFACCDRSKYGHRMLGTLYRLLISWAVHFHPAERNASFSAATLVELGSSWRATIPMVYEWHGFLHQQLWVVYILGHISSTTYAGKQRKREVERKKKKTQGCL